ncbi:hypothetical protein GUITHDRAFT_142074 [Guillardia theta CCMP2712]|uniref:DUF676 domain-containing protein n=1 Tax=Guillardia theta (strain CCMP2712) TaxID=905079 RepID=L1IYP0_GUITC|nr:hypothetical protein GUITHDRAFT_142074 [Guillardia theta CCMP2712]EKX41383.1 hypothetical protein GUITHDRAFT_142074 [Guillardia theta CCMP2712]|eukprot:XP_005828363.1 hypothetical protein GUITHDRAFT_142074 [Guillardia theta CCMP2712]
MRVKQRNDRQAGRSFALVSHSFGAILIRAAMRCEGWRRLEDSLLLASKELRCVMIAPPNQGSSLARLLRPKEDVKSVWDLAINQAASSLSDSLLGHKAGRELQAVEEGRGDWSFGNLPSYCRTLIIAGDCGAINPLLQGPNDGVITVEETRLRHSAHAHLVLTAPHNYITQHPAAVRATLDFIAGAPIPAARFFPASTS